VWAAVLGGGGAFAPLFAQQPKTPPDITRDTDRDGVPDNRDRCPGTPAGVRVDVNGCPLAATPQSTSSAAPPVSSPPASAPGAITQQAAQPSAAQPGGAKPTPPPTPSGAQPGAQAATTQPAVTQPAVTPSTGAPSAVVRAPGAPPTAAPTAGQPTAQPSGAQPSGAPPPAGAKPAGSAPAGTSPATAVPGGAAPVAVVPPAPSPIVVAPSGQPSVTGGAAPANARPAGAAPAAPAASPATVDNTLTEGFLMRGWVPNSGRPTLEYLRDFALKLDSAAQTLRNIFSTASGQPVAGATDPTKLVTREKLRWRRCRNMKEDIQTFADNVALIQDSIPATMREQWTTLGERFDSLQSVLENCETIAFMIESPERYTPWQTNYENSARTFYADWYSRLKAMHDAMRQVARLVAAQLPQAADRRQALQMIPPMSPIAPTPGGH
jgi:hypothetical protein